MVVISGVVKGSIAEKKRIKPGESIISIDGNDIVDVLDYRFYQNNTKITVRILKANGKLKDIKIKKNEFDDLGLEFETYLMDKQRSCKNKCIFCFIDQLPKGMRESLYFKDDDSRLSFLFGNYITLTNITEHEVERIIKMHISPINISVHTTNPELRCKMMNNRFAGEKLEVLKRFADAGLNINCQLVLVPGVNDGAELERSLKDLTAYENIISIACVPVGLTRFREGLEPIEPFNKQTAAETIDIINKYGEETLEKYGSRRCFPADEFFLLAERKVPETEYYEDFLQLENGVGMWALTREEALRALEEALPPQESKSFTIVTGEAAYPLIKFIVDKAREKWHNLNCRVVPIINNFFGGKITVTGLVTGSDIIAQLKGSDIGDELLIPDVMLRREGDVFLDDVSIDDIKQNLGAEVCVIKTGGEDLIFALSGENV